MTRPTLSDIAQFAVFFGSVGLILTTLFMAVT